MIFKQYTTSKLVSHIPETPNGTPATPSTVKMPLGVPRPKKYVYREFRSIQFKNLLKSFINWMETIGYNSQTIKLARWNISEFFSFLEQNDITHLKDFKNEYVDQYLEYLEHRPNYIKGGALSAGYINKHITALRWFSQYLQLSQKANIIIKPELLKTDETPGYLTKEEIKVLYKAAGDKDNLYNQRDTAMLSIFYGCGIRASEGEALNTGDILFKKNLVYVRKGKNYSERYVPINPQVKKDLKEYMVYQREQLLGRNTSNALFLSRSGTRWKFHSIYMRLQWLKEQSNNKELKQKTFGLHILRHSIATHLLQEGMALEYISRFLGHKSLETTQKYVHLIKEKYV